MRADSKNPNDYQPAGRRNIDWSGTTEPLPTKEEQKAVSRQRRYENRQASRKRREEKKRNRLISDGMRTGPPTIARTDGPGVTYIGRAGRSRMPTPEPWHAEVPPWLTGPDEVMPYF